MGLSGMPQDAATRRADLPLEERPVIGGVCAVRLLGCLGPLGTRGGVRFLVAVVRRAQ